MVCRIVVVGALRDSALLYSLCDLKAGQMDVQRFLIRELMLYKCERVHNATEATENIYCTKSKGAGDHCTLT